MLGRLRTFGTVLACFACICGHVRAIAAQGLAGLLFPTQQCLEIRSPDQLPRVPLPMLPDPQTVAQTEEESQPLQMSLDDAIRIALANSEVVRVLTGTSATSSGRTIYDPAILNTEIDRAQSAFSPSVSVGNDFRRDEDPLGVIDPADPTRSRIDGAGIDQYQMLLEASKKTVTGGTARLGVAANPSRSNLAGLPLNPQSSSSVDMEYRQPLLGGGGRPANLASILIARIETERSFYQLKDSVQQLVSGVVEAYWALVFSRTDLWAREQQVQQGQWAYDQADAKFRRGLGNAGDVAQARSTLADFKARRVTARAAVLQREAALRNILGIPPSDGRSIVPATPPQLAWIDTDWPSVLELAERYRPDLIERKLVLEQREQDLLLARNQTLPQVDATARYRWNGLEGRDPGGRLVAAEPGRFTGWQLGVEVAVPLGLADARAALRRRELEVMRDRANIEQALHQASHELANSYRNLAQFFQEYKAFKDTREAARINLEAQTARWSAGLTIYLNVLQAISSWGTAVDAEAQSLLQYNTELANLEQQTGTILESHGVHFTEEGFRSIGPMGRLLADHCYPLSSRPCSNADRYPVGTEPSENVFELDALGPPRRRSEGRPPPEPPPEPLPEPPPAPGARPVSPADLRGLFEPARGPEILPTPARGE